MRRQVFGFTIDGETSKDLDDAIWIENGERGVILSISIADVAEHVIKGGYNDTRAYSKVETRYLAQGTSPMLPRQLSEDRLSLLEKAARDTITVRCHLGEDAALERVEVFESELISLKRLTYASADQAVKDADAYLHRELVQCYLWAQKLSSQRQNSGAIAIPLGENFTITEDNKIAAVQYKSQQVIAEFMILANWAIAQFMAQQGINLLFRNHNPKPIAPERQKILQALSGFASPSYLQSLLTNWMEKAVYSPTLTGHFALALPCYCHFTSPIRRYADLINHRIIKAYLHSTQMPYTHSELAAIAQHINQYKVQIQEEKNSYFKARHQQEYQEAVLNTDTLKDLGTKEFSRVLKYVISVGNEEDIFPEVKRRIEAETIARIDLFQIIFHSSFLDLKKAALSYLESKEQEAPSVLLIKFQTDNSWKQLECIYEEPSPYKCWYVVSIDGTTLTHKIGAVGSSKQVAKNKAAVLFLSAYVHSELVNPEERVHTSQEVKAPPPPAPDLVINYIGLLQEISDSMKWEYPVYSFSQTNNTFTCQCVVQWNDQQFIGEGTHSTKKTAKHLAAKSLYEQAQAVISLPLD
ncbi:hypothetical protein BZZ01_14315 [Nostocales cyanobacterium HT-58-2]|nr:hypothetical protein BZZ01_14315 [Nostocales cyanobacterium HT-58-2]